MPVVLLQSGSYWSPFCRHSIIQVLRTSQVLGVPESSASCIACLNEILHSVFLFVGDLMKYYSCLLSESR